MSWKKDHVHDFLKIIRVFLTVFQPLYFKELLPFFIEIISLQYLFIWFSQAFCFT